MTEVTVAATFCAALVDEWVRAGLTDAVVCPGSRSTPMALALGRHRGVRLHVHHDERSAAYTALGLGLATRRPAPVLTTSGTAAVNLFPAVVEAEASAVPFLALTADRPPELQGVGAPQTIDQRHLFADHVQAFHDAGVPEDTDPATWRPLAAEAWSEALGASGVAGPVQLNLPFREPLVGEAGNLPPPPPLRPNPRPGIEAIAGLGDVLVAADQGRGIIVAGPPLDDVEGLAAFSQRWRWPVLVDPRVPLTVPRGVRRFDALLRDPTFGRAARPDVVLRLGAPPASRVLQQWLDGLDAVQVGVDRWGRVFDPGRSLQRTLGAAPGRVLAHLDSCLGRPAPVDWWQTWYEADRRAEEAIGRILTRGQLNEPLIARVVTALVGAHGASLVVSSSMPVRDVEWYGHRSRRVFANRGANGIDGVVSTAVGVALGDRGSGVPDGAASGPCVALLGDLAFLHDSNGLLGVSRRAIDLTLVVVDNDGGGIFHFLPQRRELSPLRFEELFGTPHGLDVAAVAQAFGVPAQEVRTSDELQAALSASLADGGTRVIVARTNREENVAVHDEIHGAVSAALADDS